MTENFPNIEKRRFKCPKDLEWVTSWRNEDRVSEWVDGLEYYHENENREETVTVLDLFYRENKKDKEWKYAYSRKKVRGEGKFLCIGGPLAGTKATAEKAEDYVIYNQGMGGWKRIKHPPPSAILIYKEMLL